MSKAANTAISKKGIQLNRVHYLTTLHSNEFAAAERELKISLDRIDECRTMQAFQDSELMAKTTTPGAKKKPAKSAGKKRSPAVKARKAYPPGKSKQVPYDLVYVADSDIHGKGMFACKSIDANVSLGLLEGKPARRDGIYVLWLSETEAMTVTNDFKYINHSSQPNCALTGTEVVTLKKIKPHEELTHDYGW